VTSRRKTKDNRENKEYRITRKTIEKREYEKQQKKNSDKRGREQQRKRRRRSNSVRGRDSGVTKGRGRGGSCPPPGAADEGGAKQPHRKYFNDHKSEFDDIC